MLAKVPIFSKSYRLIVLAFALAGGSGCCAPLHHLPDECAAVVYECDLARMLHDVCSSEPLPRCASEIECCSEVQYDCECDCETVVEELYERRRLEVGPPPATYKPPMPPKFLPVPSRSVFSGRSVLAPSSARSPVEVDFDGQLTFPGLE